MLWSVLSLETKMIAMFGCAIVIAFSILIVICFLIPDTWWIWPWTGESVAGETEGTGPNVKLKDFHHWPTEESTATIVDSNRKPRLSRNELCYDSSGFSLDSGRPGSYRGSSSNASSIVSEAGISPCSSRSGSTTTLQTPIDEPNRAQVHLTLQSSVVTQSDDNDVKHSALDQLLIITIENATDLPPRSYVDTVDPSVSVRLEKRNNHRLGSLMGALIGSGGVVNGRRNSHHVVTEDSTCPVVYHSRHPRFQHPVTIAVPKCTQLKDCQLVVKVEDKDKLVGVTELGQCTVDLRELDFLAGWLDGGSPERQESIVRLSRFLDISKPVEKGAILLGLSFLPTSQRITVQMTQCNRLLKTADSSLTQAVIRLFLLNESGRVLKKRKTAPFNYPNGGGGRIELNELFHLDVEIERWDRCVILLVLSRMLSNELAASQASSQESSSLDGKPQPIRSPPVYQHSGHVALGKRVTGHAERIHWNSAFQSPRRVISQWHCLH
ncbi:uncharacterized protein LOC116926118 [Daphnia magna]|uniref:uncharacterized protein LOC116926118 n=1 Tax=Daphnia magna TaxID=35525 RepID=UPI001E1BB7C6|nr:uncharacterized protein LOC116926118 [Daphnia magna]